MENKIKEIINNSLKDGKTELDSLARFEVFMNLGNEFDIRFHFDEIIELITVEDIIKRTMEKINV